MYAGRTLQNGPRGIRNPTKHRRKVAHHRLGVEAFGQVRDPNGPGVSPRPLPTDHSLEGRSKGVVVAGGYEQGKVIVGEYFHDAANGAGHDRRAGRACLDQHLAEPLGAGWNDQDRSSSKFDRFGGEIDPPADRHMPRWQDCKCFLEPVTIPIAE